MADKMIEVHFSYDEWYPVPSVERITEPDSYKSLFGKKIELPEGVVERYEAAIAEFDEVCDEINKAAGNG